MEPGKDANVLPIPRAPHTLHVAHDSRGAALPSTCARWQARGAARGRGREAEAETATASTHPFRIVIEHPYLTPVPQAFEPQFDVLKASFRYLRASVARSSAASSNVVESCCMTNIGEAARRSCTARWWISVEIKVPE